MEKRDYYETLGVSRDADAAELKKRTGFLPKNITPTLIQATQRLKKTSKKPMKPMNVLKMLTTVPPMTAMVMPPFRMAARAQQVPEAQGLATSVQ